MKHFIVIAPLALFLLQGQFFKQNHETTTEVFARTGSRGANCTGSGVCSIRTSSGQVSSPDEYKAAMGLNAEGKIFLEFQYRDLPGAVMEAQFGQAVFEMQSDCPIPENVLQLIHASEQIALLKRGSYPIKKSDRTVRVVFE